MKNEEDRWIIGKSLRKEVEKLGFQVNNQKTSMQYKTSRQITTGLVVNEKVNVKKEYYKKARAMWHELYKTGEFHMDKDQPGTLAQLEGILNFIYQVKRPYIDAGFWEKRNNPHGITKVYSDFLFYKYFVGTTMPLIITEGKTDIIYLRTALKKLAQHYNDFIEIRNNTIDYKIKFLNKSKNFRDVFSISTGTSGINHLMEIYEKKMKCFKKLKKNNAVIILIDNDEGSKEIKKKLKDKEIKNKSFYHYTDNLYILLVPSTQNKAIEDIFDKATLNIKINGKTFNPAEKIDVKKEYGKIVFAENVVKRKQDNINFNGFKEVFDNLKLIINDYKYKSI